LDINKPMQNISETERKNPQIRANHKSVSTLCLLGAAIGILSIVLTGCATSVIPPPENVENVCSIFQEKDGWYQHALDSEKKWGAPPHVLMAIVRHESRFVDNARPPRKTFLGVIPLGRPTTAYGYCQAVNGTWENYLEDTGNQSAERVNFRDAIDFVGWYTNVSFEKLGISKIDGYNQYLAYHEGHVGYSQQSYKKKAWLMRVAKRVQSTADVYASQLASCREQLDIQQAKKKATASILGKLLDR